MCEIEIKIAYIKKHSCKEKKEPTHAEEGEKNIHHHLIYENKVHVCKNGHKAGIQEANVKKRRKKKNIKYSLHPSILYTLPLSKMSYTNSPPKYKTTLKPKTTPLFVTNDKE